MDYESEDEESAYDELINAVWKEQNPLFQHKITELMEEYGRMATYQKRKLEMWP